MKIYPSHDKIDEFQIQLSSQEMKNIKQAIEIYNTKFFPSPWDRWAIEIIDKALEANSIYRSLNWK